ncbi:MAG TPA: hypothetical protein ENG87_03120 [Candidatus Pacearchaeota archaeon]|nr:hypothetical protein [Candidatus Pacearchaeota archaeon]
MKKLSLSKIHEDQINKEELYEIRGGEGTVCSCTGPIYPLYSVKNNGGELRACACIQGASSTGVYGMPWD